MYHGKMVMKIFYTKLQGRRGTGRYRFSHLEDYEKDLWEMKVIKTATKYSGQKRRESVTGEAKAV
jgi:hypothetical protein